MKYLILVLLLYSFVIGNENIKSSNLSVGYNSYDNSCYPMNDVDIFYVYKLIRKGEIKILNIQHRNIGTIFTATESYEGNTINYTFYSNMETCKKFKDK